MGHGLEFNDHSILSLTISMRGSYRLSLRVNKLPLKKGDKKMGNILKLITLVFVLGNMGSAFAKEVSCSFCET